MNKASRYRGIKRALLEGVCIDGSPLTQTEIAEEFDVARPRVYEVLKTLTEEQQADYFRRIKESSDVRSGKLLGRINNGNTGGI